MGGRAGRRRLDQRLVLALAAVLAACGPDRPAAAPAPLVLEARIDLGAVSGRIDHLALDAARNRLFIAEIGAGRVDVVDLKRRRLLDRIAGLSEPQGVGFVAATDQLYVASGGDGSVRIFAGADLKP